MVFPTFPHLCSGPTGEKGAESQGQGQSSGIELMSILWARAALDVSGEPCGFWNWARGTHHFPTIFNRPIKGLPHVKLVDAYGTSKKKYLIIYILQYLTNCSMWTQWSCAKFVLTIHQSNSYPVLPIHLQTYFPYDLSSNYKMLTLIWQLWPKREKPFVEWRFSGPPRLSHVRVGDHTRRPSMAM